MIGLILLALFVCPVPSIDQTDKIIGAGWDLPSKKYWRTFDLNGDLAPDFHVEYEIKGIKEDKTFLLSPFPVVYYWDKEYTGFYSEVWIDTQGNGKCKDFRPYIGKEKQ